MQSAFVFIQVPKYVSEKWKKATGKCEVGKLKITRSKYYIRFILKTFYIRLFSHNHVIEFFKTCVSKIVSHKIKTKSCLVYTNLFKFDCETSNVCLCK